MSWRFVSGISKRTVIHAAFLALVGIVVWQAQTATALGRDSLLYAYISGEKVVEGPLDPSAYAQTSGPGTGGARLAAVDTSNVNLITFDDPEVQFAQTLSGNAVVAPLQPIAPEPATDERAERREQTKEPTVYTVKEGDTVSSIAANFGVSTNTILWANGLGSSETIKVGDHLTILPTTGVLHTVASGDTVTEIASAYDAKAGEIIAYNDLGEDASLSIGEKVIVPDGYVERQRAPRVVSQDTRIARDTDDGPTPSPAPAEGSGFVWPTTTRHISQYFRWGHTGIDIDNRARPAIFAAAGGTVEFAGWLGAYGNLVIVNHGNGLTTYYAHSSKFYVNKGQTVSKGQAIAKMGSTGRSTGPHVHFEVRRNGRPINPLGLY